MKKLLMVAVFMCSPAFATDTINLTSSIKNHNGKKGEGIIIAGFHTANIKNTTGTRQTYKFSWCSGLTNDIECYSKIFTLQPNQTFNEHYNSGSFVVKGKGTYPIAAKTKVNDVVVESHAILTVR